MKKSLVFLFLALFLYACGGVDTQALKNEVLDMHDEVMPKMGELMSLRKKVLAKSQELLSQPEFDQSEVASLDSLASELEIARKGMMTWMNDWSKNASSYLDHEDKPVKGVSEEAVLEYLNIEKQRISDVNDNFNATIEFAKKLLKN